MKTMPRTQAPMVEGRQAFNRFDAGMGKLLSVSREEMLHREAEYKRQAALNPHKRGPKPKLKTA
jgi:hypothetical protein